MIDLSGFAPRDAKIIKENDGKTPYELSLLGLSTKAYERLVAGDVKEKKEEPTIKKATPEEIATEQAYILSKQAIEASGKSNIVQPKSVQEVPQSKTKLTAPNVYKAQKAASSVGTVQVYNKRTGRTTKMSVSAANRLIKQPNLYQILR